MTLQADFAIPGDLATPTGGYEYDRQLMQAAPGAGLSLRHLPLRGAFPTPTEAEMEAALSALAATPGPVLADGLALGALPAARLAPHLPPRLIALCHHPLGTETGLDPAEARRLIAMEASILAACAGVVTTSDATARTLVQDLRVLPDKIVVAPPGLERAEPAPRRGEPPMILGVGTISARKDWPTLVEALAKVSRPFRCVIAGADDRDPAAAATLRECMRRVGLEDRVTLAGARSRAELDRLYAEADLFALPSRHEGYGMVVTEAMARGLPVIASDAGAIPEAAGGAARLVPPGDPEAWAEALDALLADAGERDRMATDALARTRALPDWIATARLVAGALGRVA